MSSKSGMIRNTQVLQIATFGEDQEGIAAGIRNFPIHKLLLLCYTEDRKKAEGFGRRISSTIGIPVGYLEVSKNDVIRSVLERLAEVLTEEGQNYDQILMNVSSGDKMIGCAALSAAFVNGIKAFGIDNTGCPMLLPILRLSYNEVISDAKLEILRKIDQAGGEIESLEKLSEISTYGKPLLSYHIHGGGDSKGLEDLGLIETVRGSRGKVAIKITTLGKLLISSK